MKKYFLMQLKSSKAIIAAFLLMSIAISISAQPGQGRRFSEHHEKIHSRKVAFITNKLELTPTEAQAFWPVYNEFTKKQKELMQEKAITPSCYSDIDEMSEAELIELAEKEVIMAEAVASLRREYHEKYMEVLPVKKVIKLYIAEKEFNRELFREMRRKSHRESRPRN